MANDLEIQKDEIIALASIYEDSFISSLKLKKDNTQCDPELNTNLNGVKITKQKEKHCIQYLPPLNLHFTFPLDYPSQRSPDFTLSCKWLNNFQLSQLCRKLDEEWKSNDYCEIMFTWAQYLKEETLNELLIVDELDLEKAKSSYKHGNFCSNGSTLDRRGIQDIGFNTNLFLILRDFDEKSRKKVFDSKSFLCKICFEKRGGSNCVAFWPCNHVFCSACTKSYFEILIQEGTMKQLKCPENQCNSEANPKQVEDLVSIELYKKWDEMLLNSTLFSLDDVQPCPRKHCQYPVTIEETLGSCPMCSFVFCAICRFGSHGLENCKFKSIEAKDILNKYLNGSEDEKKILEEKYNEKYLKCMVEEHLTSQYIDKNARECPKCKINIEKIDGCNKMTCNRCDINFCWICELRLDNIYPYLHFSNPKSPCFDMLFHGIEEEPFLQD